MTSAGNSSGYFLRALAYRIEPQAILKKATVRSRMSR
jgi:hypothetical protein